MDFCWEQTETDVSVIQHDKSKYLQESSKYKSKCGPTAKIQNRVLQLAAIYISICIILMKTPVIYMAKKKTVLALKTTQAVESQGRTTSVTDYVTLAFSFSRLNL